MTLAFMLVVAVIVWSRIAHAALPDIVVTQGAVAASSAATYQPATVGPVAFSDSGACPRWTGAINDTNLAATPVSSAITASKLEAGSIVTFAIILQNTTATDPAYDILLNHDIPTGLELPGTGAEGANLCVHDGLGAALPYSTNGAGFFSNNSSDNIELTDGPGGALTAAGPVAGTNIAVITFDLKVSTDYVPGSTKNPTVELLGYSDTDNGNLLPGSTATTAVKTRDFEQVKAVQSTNLSTTTGNFVAIGEQVTYELTVSVPEGEASNVSVLDEMPVGLAFVGCDSITNDDPSYVTTDLAGGFGAACDDPTNPTVTNSGRDITFNLGNLVNTNQVQPDDETITIVYTGVVTNVVQAATSVSLNNSARVFWTGGDIASASAPVVVHEPKIAIATTLNPTTSVNVGDQVLVTTTLTHAVGSTTSAYQITTTSTIPAGFDVVAGSLQCLIGVAPGTCSITGNQLTATFDQIDSADVATITYQITPTAMAAGQSTAIAASSGWSSLPASLPGQQSTYSVLAVARTGSQGDPGGANNTYATSSSASLSVASIAGVSPNATASTSDDNSLSNTGVNWWVVIALGVIITVFSGYVLTMRRLR